MNTPTLTNAAATSTDTPSGRPPAAESGRGVPGAVGDDPRRADRAMWRSELTLRQLCQWSSRAQHEVPMLAGEFAWIVMRTPEWA
jgi:hypothetical protein